MIHIQFNRHDEEESSFAQPKTEVSMAGLENIDIESPN
jgi:hypothetical protein